MKRIARSVAALLALACAALPASASAEAPEYGRCVKHAGGRFTTARCTAEATGGGWEWEPGPGPKAHFTEALKGTSIFKFYLQNGGYPGECKHASMSGEYTGAKTVGNVHLVFTECLSSARCPTIELAPLVGELGVYALGETAEKNKIGLELRPEVGSGLAEFACESEFFPTRNWRGGFVIGQVPSNVMQLTTGSVVFKQHHERGEVNQIPASFLGQAPSPLETTGAFAIEHSQDFVEMGWQLSLAVHNEEAIEANSVA